MKRRDLMTAGPVMLAATVLPAAAMTEAADSPIRKLFREWAAAQQAAENSPGDMPEDEFNALCDRACDLGDQIIALPASDASEWMLKLVAWTMYGAHELQSCSANPAVWDEARALMERIT